MTDILTSRRGFLTGLGAALITAPAIVRAGSLMPVKATMEYHPELGWRSADWASRIDLAELARITRGVFLPRMYVQIYASSDISRMLQIAAGG